MKFFQQEGTNLKNGANEKFEIASAFSSLKNK